MGVRAPLIMAMLFISKAPLLHGCIAKPLDGNSAG
jgi:hypothetical protein